MAQTNYTPISLYYSTTASAVPTAANLVPGELAINTNDGKLYYEDSSGVVQVLATKSTGSIGGSNTQVQFNNSGSLGGSSSFTWDGTTVTATKFAGALNGTVGATTASTGAFTTLSTSSTTTLSGLTASTALALDASKNVVSVTNTGTGNNVLSASPTLTGTIAGASLSLSSLTSGRVTFAGASGLLSDSSKLTFDTSNLTVGVTGLSANADGATGKLVLRKPNEASGNGQITRMLDFAPYYPGYDEAVVKASISSGVDTGTQNGQLGFMVATGGVLYEKMRILANGNVGIGTSSPSQPLTVNGVIASIGQATALSASSIFMDYNTTSNSGRFAAVGNTTGTAAPIYFSQYSSNASVGRDAVIIDSSGNVGIGTSSPVSNAGYSALTISNTTGAQIYWKSTTSVVTAYAGADSNGGYLATSTSHPLIFRTVDTERMRIDTSGNLLVGTTAALAKFVVDGTAYISSATGIATTRTTGKLNIDANINSENGIDIQSLQSPANGSFIIFRNSSGAAAGSITHISSTAVLYNTTSDQRVKTNIIDAPSGNIDNIKIRSFDWIEDGGHQEYGMIAQELVTVAPYAVHQPTNPDEMMGVDYSKLVPMMIKEIQDLKQRIATLENK